jgi:cytochrome c biogenesis protein CcdA
VREFLISVASGIVVAIVSALLISRSGHGERSAPNQSQSGSSQGKVLLAFLLGAAIVFAVLMAREGRLLLPQR